jgi:hypothetical protein
MHRIQVYGLLVSIGIFVLILELVRRQKIREEYSLLWLFSGFILLVIGIFPKIVDAVSLLTQTYYLTTLLIIGFSFLFFIVLHFSVVISRLTERVIILMQQMSILYARLEEKEINGSN